MTERKKYIGDLFVTQRFYVVMGTCAVAYIFSFFFNAVYNFVNIFFLMSCVLFLVDYVFLFIVFKPPFAKRKVADRLSNGAINSVSIFITNRMPFFIDVQIIDEVPVQMQERNLTIRKKLGAKKTSVIKYTLTPSERGNYEFGNIIIFIQSQLGFLQKRETIKAIEQVKVYPSFINLGKYHTLSEPVF